MQCRAGKPMAKAKPGHRIVLHLDPRIALEEIILNRRERIPATRRQEWLRGLLVQGFLSECQSLRSTSDEATRRPTMGLKNRNVSDAQESVGLTEPEPVVATVTHSQANTANKPFAALGKVIG
jgi:hypothetical protein